MKLELKEFQLIAVDELYEAFVAARPRVATSKLEAITLSSPTGSGKTVILTRLIELLLSGDESHQPDSDASVLWVTDQPELNIQTRDKMLQHSDLLTPGNLIEIGPDFDYESCPRGAVLFLNTQKLADGSQWVTESDRRDNTLWQTFSRTIEERPAQFLVVIDEAHRGTRLDPAKAAEANSKMQRFLFGFDEMPPAPLIVGISATLDRFTELLSAASKAKKARTHHPVVVDPIDVIDSGLLKHRIFLRNPEDPTGAEFPLLRESVRSWAEFTARWEGYCQVQDVGRIVKPVLVIQVQDGTAATPSKTNLEAVVSAIRDEAPDLGPLTIAHSFESHSPLQLEDGSILRYIPPSSIESDPTVRVVLFKKSLNTGWDCPRAEVMMSFRSAKQGPHIGQLVGRMVRTPLARSVEMDEVLNSVMLFLPHYDVKELDRVVKYLTSDEEGVPPTAIENVRNREVLTKANGMEKAFAALTGLPTYVIPRKRRASEVQRLGLLADTLSDTGLRPGAGNEARDHLADMLLNELKRRATSSRYRELLKKEGTIFVNTIVLNYRTELTEEGESMEIPISDESVTELYEWARKKLGLDLALRFWKRRVEDGGLATEDYVTVKLELYALASDGEVLSELEDRALSLTDEWLNAYKESIKTLVEADRIRFEEVKRRANKPVAGDLDFSERLTLEWIAHEDAAKWPNHLYTDEQGRFSEKLNSWESSVLREELKREGFVAWLRNKEQRPWALCIPYQVGGVWRGMYPDFLLVRQSGKKLTVDIVDPHLTTLEDAPVKAAALARYADNHQDLFGRVDLIIVEKPDKPDMRIRRLRLIEEAVRKKVMGVTTNQHLRDLFDYAG